MNTIYEIVGWLQIALISGLAMRIIYCCIRLTGASDDAQQYKKRLKNAVMIAVISVAIVSVKDLLISYFGNGY